MKYTTEELIEALQENFSEISDVAKEEEIETRLYQLQELYDAVMNMASAIHQSEKITLEPPLLFALTDLFSITDKINIEPTTELPVNWEI
tara:strand:- start:492 stop:761 length:270 start_codon:yes stop_codon:yes gene_type:complete